MKVLPKPISSPSRTEKFPPPLLRFLRSNGGSRSRGRSRSSPIFIRKRNETAIVTDTQEPSSPKVTCMGQVRVKRSKQKQRTVASTKQARTTKKSRWCWWIRKALFFNGKSNNPRTSKPFWFRKKVEIRKETKDGKRDETEEEEEDEDEREAKVFVSSTIPPKNALLLMRCRSEPFRASSLANRFWGSEETEPEEEEEEDQRQKKEENPTLKNEPTCRDSAIESRKVSENEEKLEFCERFENSTTSNSTKVEKKEEEEIAKTCRPLILTRCKSEPARKTEKFDTEICLWKRRLDLVDISTTTRFL